MLFFFFFLFLLSGYSVFQQAPPTYVASPAEGEAGQYVYVHGKELLGAIECTLKWIDPTEKESNRQIKNVQKYSDVKDPRVHCSVACVHAGSNSYSRCL